MGEVVEKLLKSNTFVEDLQIFYTLAIKELD